MARRQARAARLPQPCDLPSTQLTATRRAGSEVGRSARSRWALEMVERDPTFVGRVQQVIGSQVTVALDRSLAGVAPIYRGKLQAIGQIGSLVRIPQGLVDLIGTVSLLGIAELAGSQLPAETVQTGDR